MRTVEEYLLDKKLVMGAPPTGTLAINHWTSMLNLLRNSNS